MIGILAKVAYHGQLRRSEPGLAEEMAAALRGAATELGAALRPREESFLLLFEEGSGCAELRAAEALRRLGLFFRALAPRLHGWNLLLEAGSEGAEALDAELERLWLGAEGDGPRLGPRAARLLEGYLELEGGSAHPVVAFPYAGPALPESYAPPPPDPRALERLVEELTLLSREGATLLVAAGPGAGELLEAALPLAGHEPGSVLRLRAGCRPPPYAPFLGALPPGRPPELELATPREAAFLAELEAAAAFIASSPARRRYGKSLESRFRRYASLRLELWARALQAEGRRPLLLLEGLDAFPPESLSLLEELLEPATGAFAAAERPLLLASSAGAPPRLGGLALRPLSAPPPSPAALADTALRGAAALGRPSLAPELARLARGDPFRLGLGLRIAAASVLPSPRIETAELARLALATFPPEFAEFLRALALAEEALEEETLGEFLGAAGFSRGLRPLLFGSLGQLGYLDRLGGGLSRPEAAEAAQAEPGRIEAIFVERLLALHESRRIQPSLALYRRVLSLEGSEPRAEDQRRDLFLLDCLAAEILHGPSEEEDSATLPPGSPLGLLAPFLRASARGEAGEAAAARELLEARRSGPGASPLLSLCAGLAGAFDDYARGRLGPASGAVKSAIIGLHALGARRPEARAHRLLGLANLALAQVAEGAEYLANAAELAELVPDRFEAFHAAYAGAGAALVLGDLRRAEQRRAEAQRQAGAAFRSDWEAACDFLSGRIAFELGRYPEAEAHFGRARAEAKSYGELPALLRAEIWAGRAAAGRGSVGRARELLEGHCEDPEALWFLAELRAWEGDWTEAAALSGAARLRLSLHRERYRSADALDWDSGFENLEGRALGFAGPTSYLSDQVEAFASFAHGMAEGDPEALSSIMALTRERRLASLHPQAPLYDFYCFRIAERLGGVPVDGGSFLSRAWKALQTRTARMDEAVLKDSYLEGNRWNREILRAARLAKLL